MKRRIYYMGLLWVMSNFENYFFNDANVKVLEKIINFLEALVNATYRFLGQV